TPLLVTTTPQVLGATPTALPTVQGNSISVTPEVILMAPGLGQPTQPALYLDPSKDGHIYYIKGQALGQNNNGGDCGVNGFDGGASSTQTPTTDWVNLGS